MPSKYPYFSKALFIVLLYFASISSVSPKTVLQADGNGDTYQLINQIFGGYSSALEVPDCKHAEFGPHITQQWDYS
jgi:hypothetical protein